MKKLILTLMCLVAMLTASTSLKAQEVTVVLNPGWTWISVPGTEPQSFATALGSFVPMEGDMIKSQWGNASFRNGQWKGQISQFYPGYGYHYKSNRQAPEMITVGNPLPSLTVTTAEPTNVTSNSATSGGSITTDAYVFTKGICWATHPEPTPMDDDHSENGGGDESFTAEMTELSQNTTYYVRAYAVTQNGIVYGNEVSFNTIVEYEYVDLGLPSGLLWAACNLGADVPEDYGDYFAWGETQPKDNFSWTNYQYCMGSFNTLTKYCNNPDIGYNGFTDDLTTLLPEDDAATANWGDDWRMPTVGEWQELYENTTVTWTTQNGVNGRLFTALNGNSLFLPSAGYCNESIPEAAGIIGDYWTSSLDTDYPSGALSFFFNSSNYYIGFCNRLYGRNVRAVRPSQNHAYVDLGLPSGLLWATCNVGADVPEDYGDYFAWGETQPKDYYEWSTYQYCNGSGSTLTKYCTNSNNGYNGFTDNLTTLLPEDDAATANWGADWRMPTGEEWQELIDNTTCTWTTRNGVNGRLYTASNGNSLFLPAAGYRLDGSLYRVGTYGNYWSSSLYTEDPNFARNLYSHTSNYYMYNYYRFNGFPIRPVSSTSPTPTFIIDATANPAEGGEVSGGGTYQAGAECTLTATSNEGYTFTSWTENDEVVSTDAVYTFTVDADRNLMANFTYNGGGDEHAYVDLGLPSGLLWATCNVGADVPEDYGDHFAWGETQPKDYYDWNTYQYCNGSENTLTKYCNNSDYGYNGFIDNLTMLLSEDDAATVNWGEDWRIPTNEEWQELYNNTTQTWATQNGVRGQLFTASNGNSLFLPAAGCCFEGSILNAGSDGNYWSSLLETDSPCYAWDFYFFWDDCSMSYDDRYSGRSVRAVRSGLQNNIPTGAINGKFTINADGDQVYFSQGNLQYQASTNTWRFADNQYDYVGSTNSNISSTYSGWIDLFGWGTSGYNHGANCYQPWSTSQTNSDYYAYGSYTYNLYDQTGQADWGYNPISNGGNQTNQWRTLTNPEWNYVFNTRTTTSGIRYAKAKVNNVNGVILLPDDWSTSTYSLSNTNTYDASFNSNTLTASQWSTLEQAGAVFLPAAGVRYGTSVYNVGSYGYYWSASYYSSNSAYYVCFDDSSLNAGGWFNRYFGQSVRLVAPAEN